jgi:hypothetical protein
MLGHATLAMTADVYGHPRPGERRREDGRGRVGVLAGRARCIVSQFESSTLRSRCDSLRDFQ